MTDAPQGLQIDPVSVNRDIEDLLQSTIKNLHRDGAVIGLSGGLDSAVVATLMVRALGAEKVHLLNMPERDSNPLHQEHAQLMADHLGIKLKVRPITPILEATSTYTLLPLSIIPQRGLRALVAEYSFKLLKNGEKGFLTRRLRPEADSLTSKGIAYSTAKHRIRMVVLYQYAEVHNLMVVGAANRTECLTGAFSKWGIDHCADVMPVMHLYRSQLEALAEYLEVPEYIRSKPSDPDLLPGINDKGKMLGGFDRADQILYGMETGVDKDVLIKTYGKEYVEQLLELWELSAHMRESPYHGSVNGQ